MCYSISSIKHDTRHHHFYIGANNFSNIWGNRLLSMKIDYMLLDNQTPLSSLSALTWIAYRLYQCADPLKLCVFASKLSHQRPPKLQSVHKTSFERMPRYCFLLETWDNQGSNKFGLSHFLIGHSRVRLFPRLSRILQLHFLKQLRNYHHQCVWFKLMNFCPNDWWLDVWNFIFVCCNPALSPSCHFFFHWPVQSSQGLNQ